MTESTLRIISQVIGYSSVVCWLIVGFPQFYQNYRNKSGAGISVSFLIFWLIGDVVNIIGCILGKQLITELALAIWYTIMDVLLLLQIYYYHIYYTGSESVDIFSERRPLITNSDGGRREQNKIESSAEVIKIGQQENENNGGTLIESLSHSPRCYFKAPSSPQFSRLSINDYAGGSGSMDYSQVASVAKERSDIFKAPSVEGSPSFQTSKRLFTVGGVMVFFFTLHFLQTPDATYNDFLSTNEAPLRRLLSVTNEDLTELCTDINPKHLCLIGQVLGWLSSALYILSRIPQIVKNLRRRSMEGLSMTLFLFCVLGNLTFSASIFVYSTRKEFLIEKAPWIVGSLGTMAGDTIIFLQFFLYRDKQR